VDAPDEKESTLDKSYALWKQQQTDESMLDLLRKAGPTLSASVRSYVGVDDPTAATHAKLLAMKAIRGFDPKRGVKLRTHLMTQLQPLRRFAARRRNILNVPEQVQYELAGVAEAEKELQEVLARDPSDLEVAEKLQLSPKRLAKLRGYSRGVLAEGQYTDGQGAPTQPTVYTPGVDRWVDYVYYDLSPIDRKIFEWRTGYNGIKKLQNNVIASKLGLSAGAISQRVDKIRKMLEQGAAKKAIL
jgi:DNA-directed RNA polymerase specialized sigma subunit